MAGTFGAGLLGMGGGAVIGGSIVRLFLDSKEFDAALARSKGELDSTATSSQKFGAIASAAYVAVGVAAVKFAASSIQAFDEQAKIMAQTDAVIKSTGGAAGYTAVQIHEMAAALQQSTTYSDESIQSAENLLLTFRSIGSDVFPQTTQAVLDMSTALNQDLKSSAIQLGKAMQDPLVGLTALRRVGVSFTADQVTLIKSLVATNDLLGAQKIILKEVTTEFGGSAAAATETFAGQLEQLKNQFNDIQEKVGQALIPVLDELLSLAKRLTPVIGDTLVAAFQTLADQIQGANDVIEPFMSLLGQIPGLGDSVDKAGTKMSGSAKLIGSAFAGVGVVIGGTGRLLDDWIQANVDTIHPQAKFVGSLVDLKAAFGMIPKPVGQAQNAVRSFAGKTGKDLQAWQADTSKAFSDVIGNATSFSSTWIITGHKYATTMRQMTAAGDRLVADQKKLAQQVRHDTTPAFQAYAAELAKNPPLLDAYVHSSSKVQQQDFSQWKQQQKNQTQFDQTTTALTRMSTQQTATGNTLKALTDFALGATNQVKSLGTQIDGLPSNTRVGITLDITPSVTAGALQSAVNAAVANAVAGLKHP